MADLAFLFLQTDDWGGSEPTHWPTLLGRGASLLLFGGFAFLVLRAIWRGRRYRAMDILGPADLEQLHTAIADAEKRTVGEILPVVVERSDDHPAAHWRWALFAMLLGSALLVGYLPWDHPAWLLACQVGLGLVGYGASISLPDLQRLLVTEVRAEEMAQEQAFQEFYAHDLHETDARTGVLIFVSLFERRVIVLGDKGIASKVGEAEWKATDEAILAGIRAGSLRDGLLAGIERCADVLAEHFPWEDGDRNEIPDRIVVRKR